MKRLVCAVLISAAIAAQADWKDDVRQMIPLMGHRNWIVVADSAYPAQNSSGIVTLVTNSSQKEVVDFVLQELSKAKHVSPIIHLDREIDFVPESDAPGVAAYRQWLDGKVKGKSAKKEGHLDIIKMLEEAGKSFKVLILKTDFTVPYTSVFCELDCAYWGPEKEARMRKQMEPKSLAKLANLMMAF